MSPRHGKQLLFRHPFGFIQKQNWICAGHNANLVDQRVYGYSLSVQVLWFTVTAIGTIRHSEGPRTNVFPYLSRWILLPMVTVLPLTCGGMPRALWQGRRQRGRAKVLGGDHPGAGRGSPAPEKSGPDQLDQRFVSRSLGILHCDRQETRERTSATQSGRRQDSSRHYCLERNAISSHHDLSMMMVWVLQGHRDGCCPQ